MKKEKTKRKPKLISMKVAYENGMLSNKPAMVISDYFKSILFSVKDGKTLSEIILLKQAEMASKGDTKSAEFLFDRAYGRPTQTVVQESTPVVTIQHNVITVEQAKEQSR